MISTVNLPWLERTAGCGNAYNYHCCDACWILDLATQLLVQQNNII